MKFNQFGKKLFLLTAAFCGLFLANSPDAFAQFTFNGDYDKTFAAPNGYYADGQFPTPGQEVTSSNIGGILNPDGSVVAGGIVYRTANDRPDIYLRKFTATGAVDTSFGTNGYVRTVFFTEFNGIEGSSFPAVIKRQADGKIIVGGTCQVLRDTSNQNVGTGFGTDWCLVRYNANGSIDTSFGNNNVQWGNTNATVFNQLVGQGRVAIQTGINENGDLGASSSTLRDIAIQPDGKIVVVGQTRDYLNPFFQGSGTQRQSGLIVRFNANGSLDGSFGANGYARYAVTNPVVTNCYPDRGFHGVTIQPDGRIIALGNDGTSDAQCFRGKVFVVTRWSANGNFESSRRLDGNTSVFADEKATAAIVTRDGGKILVSGSYQSRPTLLRMNTSDLSVDTTFGTNGIVGYAPSGGNGLNLSLYIKAIQPDGKIIGVDNANLLGSGVVRFNPNGTGDLSFGNYLWDNNAPNFGRIRLAAALYRGTNPDFRAADLALRPNGRLIIFGTLGDGQANRSFISQHNTNFRSGIYSDFTNDGKADISVFRTGAWYYLNSANNQFSGVTFGQSDDRPIPADFDGDGKTDVAVYRPSNGYWYILQSSNNQFRAVLFGISEDLPRPGDFDGDGFADIAVFRPSNGTWYYLRSSDGQFRGVAFGQSGDLPLIGDFDGDGKSDIAVFRSGNWYYLQSSDNQFRGIAFGFGSDFPTVGDYDGDGKSDISVFRPSNGYWYRLNSSNGAFVATLFGQNGDKPVAADYDNDGRTDLAIFRSGAWYGLRSGDNSVFGISFGAATDVPIPAAYLP